MKHTEDEQLMAAFAAGREEAFAVLLRRHESGLRGFFRRRLGNMEDAAEATQDVFVKVARAADTFRADGAFRPWLLTIARNVLTDRLRRRPAAEVVPLCADPVGDLGVYREERSVEEVREALRALPPPYRAALALRYLAGLSYRDAARELGLGEKGFETRLYRAKELLRRELSRRGRDGLR